MVPVKKTRLRVRPEEAKRGLPAVDWGRELKRVRELAGLSREEFAYAFPVPLHSLVRMESGETKPSALVKIRAAELRRLFEHARQVAPKATSRVHRRWFTEPNDLLNGASCLDVLRRPGGVETVDDELGRLEWGIPT